MSTTQTTLPPNNTPLTPAQAASALNAAYRQVTGQTPTLPILGLLLGQTGLETGNWQKMPNYNFGGIKASAGDRLIQVFDTAEVVNGVLTPVKHTFAAYENVAEGAASYIRTLRARPHWWNGLHTATAEGFVAGLITPPAYFTANPAHYLNGLKARIHAFLKDAEQAVLDTFSPPAVAVPRQPTTGERQAPLVGGGGGAAVGLLVLGVLGTAALKRLRS